MKRLYILCEGQTEEDFVSIILSPYLQNIGVITIPIIFTTKRTPTKKYKGGVSSFSKIKKELQRLCGEHPNELVTTMFDLYAFPYDTLGLENIPNDIYAKAEHIEKAIADEIGNKFGNMVFSLVLHEFEGLLFSDVSAFESIADNETVAVLRGVRAAALTPEHINESPETAPSKHIERAIPNYSKVGDGIDIAEQIGIDKIKNECRHFANWLAKLTAWAKESAQ
ncbi:MAG: DUF4276 family protein [Defluviitaleaceae bacterium]|nr:DUF4276 family protein [Defluviitaleaceae bacterium]